MNNVVFGIVVALALLVVWSVALGSLWLCWRGGKVNWRRGATLQIDAPDGIGDTASIKFMGRELRGVAAVTFYVPARGNVECTLHIHPSTARILAGAISPKLIEWIEEAEDEQRP